MKTEIWKIDPAHFERRELQAAAALLRSGRTVAFPTETVYGIGANALDADAVQAIFTAKGRPADNPLIVHIHKLEELELLADDIPSQAYELATAFWPGPLTLVLRKKPQVPALVSAGLPTVAIRMPDEPLALALLEEAGLPLAAPSANISGKPSPTSAADVAEDLAGRVAGIVDGGRTAIGLESTVLDLTGKEPEILRSGALPIELLREILPQVRMAVHTEEAAPRSPGMKYRHYSPQALLRLFDIRSEDEVRSVLRAFLGANQEKKKALMITTETRLLAEDILADYPATAVFELGSRNEPATAATRLFAVLREADRRQVDDILAETFTETGLGTALTDRLSRAAGGKYFLPEVKE